MKQKLIEALVTKFGIDAKMVEGIAERLSKTVTTDEEVATAVEGVTFQHVLESYADKRANDASETARKNAIKKYETQYNLKDGKPIEPEPEPEPKGAPKPAEPSKPSQPTTEPKKKEDEVPQYVKDILEQNKALAASVKSLTDKVAGFEKKSLTTSRREQLDKAIASLTDKQRKPYSRIALDGMTDDEFSAFLEEVSSDAAAMVKENNDTKAALEAASHRPTVGTFQVNGKASKEELDSVMKGIH